MSRPSLLQALKGASTRIGFGRHGDVAILQFLGSMKRLPKGLVADEFPEGVMIQLTGKKNLNVEEARELAAWINAMVGDGRPEAAAPQLVPEPAAPQGPMCPDCQHPLHDEGMPICIIEGCGCAHEHRAAAREIAA